MYRVTGQALSKMVSVKVELNICMQGKVSIILQLICKCSSNVQILCKQCCWIKYKNDVTCLHKKCKMQDQALWHSQPFKLLNSSQQNIRCQRNALRNWRLRSLNDGATFIHVLALYITLLVCFDKFNTEGFVMAQLGLSI